MLKIRSAALGAALIAGITSVAGAQATTAGPATHATAQAGARHERGEAMSDLNLTAAQKTQIKAIREKYSAQEKQLRGTGTPADSAHRQQLLALRTQERTEIRALLTAEQQAKFDARAAGRGRGHTKGMKGMKDKDMKDMKGMEGMKGMKPAEL